MKNIDLDRLHKDVTLFAQEREWDQFHTLKNLSMALSVETSELLEIFQWLKEEESNRIMEDAVQRKRVEEEVADVFLYLLQIVGKAGIDLEDVVRRKMQKNREKYPVELSRGSSKKYDEL